MTDPSVPYVPVPIGPDPARDARVAARRAADARKATLALDALLGKVQREADVIYGRGWLDGYAASEEHHNGHYGVPALDYGTGCTCACLGVGTPEHAPGPLCHREFKGNAHSNRGEA